MENNQNNRRSFLARAVELVATVPLIGLVVENFRNRTSYYEIDSSGAQALNSPSQSLAELSRIDNSLKGHFENLNSSYRSAYHKSHTRLVPYTYTVGKNTYTGLRPETYYTWEEPSNVPRHDVVEGWGNFHSGFSSKVEAVSRGATIDLEKLEELKVLRQRTGKGREGLMSLAIYSPQIAGLLFYEEAIAEFKHGHERHNSMEELVEKHDTLSQITRRSFFKVGAALAGAAASSPIVCKNRQKREEGKTKLEGEIEDMKVLTELSGEESFIKYFGINPNQLISQYKNQLDLSRATLRTNVEDAGVRTAFSEFADAENKHLISLEHSFDDGVPGDMRDAIKSTLIAKNLRDKSASEHRAVYTGLGVTGLAVAGTIAATLLPLEFANEYFSNKR